eukprot:507396-Alexandrium_andersonii.AAC.1
MDVRCLDLPGPEQRQVLKTYHPTVLCPHKPALQRQRCSNPDCSGMADRTSRGSEGCARPSH